MKLRTMLVLLIALSASVLSEDAEDDLQKLEEEINTNIQAVKTVADDLYSDVQNFVEETRLKVQLLEAESRPDKAQSAEETKALYRLFFNGGQQESVVSCTRQKNKLDAIRLHRRDSVVRCSARIEATARDTQIKAELAKVKGDHAFANGAANITAKCRTMDDKSSCLDSVRREAGVRVEGLRRAVESARTFSSLKKFESQLGIKFCRQVTEAYNGVIVEERDTLRKCIENNGGKLSDPTSSNGETDPVPTLPS